MFSQGQDSFVKMNVSTLSFSEIKKGKKKLHHGLNKEIAARVHLLSGRKTPDKIQKIP